MDIKTIKNQPNPSIRTPVFLYSQSEKMKIIDLVEKSGLSIKKTLRELVINRSTFTAGITFFLKAAKPRGGPGNLSVLLETPH